MFFCVCELGMPIIFVCYMMMEADPTSEMCLNLKKRYKGDRRSQVHATSLTPSQTFMLSWLKLTCLQYCVRR